MEQMRKRIKIIGAIMLTLLVVTGAAAIHTVFSKPTTATAHAEMDAETTRVDAQTTEPIQTTTEPKTANVRPQDAQEPEPAWNTATHQNGYCEGECWEGICPYFEGYPEPPYTDREIEMLAKAVWGEARGCAPEEQRLVIWTAFQRVDAGGEFRNYNTIEAVLTKENAFVGYDEGNPVDPEIYALCAAEAADWAHGAEPPILEPYATATPYLFFDGDGTHNWFRGEW